MSIAGLALAMAATGISPVAKLIAIYALDSKAEGALLVYAPVDMARFACCDEADIDGALTELREALGFMAYFDSQGNVYMELPKVSAHAAAEARGA